MSETLRQRKADRFERLAKKELKSPWVMNEARLAMLLHREHQAVVRALEKHRDWACEQGCSSTYENAILHVLHIIKQRAQ